MFVCFLNFRTQAERNTSIERRCAQFTDSVWCLGTTCITEDRGSSQSKEIWKEAPWTCWYIQNLQIMNRSLCLTN